MKRLLSVISVLMILMLLCGCGASNENSIEELKAEYAKYDPYSDLIDALIVNDYDLAEELVSAYRANEYNTQVTDGMIQEIVITNDNWSEYFEIKKLTEWVEDDFGNTTGFITHVCIVISDEYVNRVCVDKTNINFGWKALCSVKNCDVDLENRTIAYENEFKSTSTTFGDPEHLFGTVTFNQDTFKMDAYKQDRVVAEIGEVIIVGEYLLGEVMKPVCFDYDDVSIIQAEGVLSLYNIGE